VLLRLRLSVCAMFRSLLFCCLAVATFASSSIHVQSEDLASNSLPWDRVDVTWAKFSGIPLKAEDAQRGGWVLSGSSCLDQNVSWAGNRYLLGGDLSAAPLYDSAGNLAGYQFGMYEAPPAPVQNIWQPQTAFSPSGASYWTLTTYFVDPKTICSTAANSKLVTRRAGNVAAIGDRLVLQTAKHLMTMPLNENSAAAAGWVNGKCFYTMGQHWWYNMTSTMSCDNIFPLFIIYNNHVLTTYGVITGVGTASQYLTSSRWEHPGGVELNLFLQSSSAPACIFSAGDLSTQHVFLTEPLTDFC